MTQIQVGYQERLRGQWERARGTRLYQKMESAGSAVGMGGGADADSCWRFKNNYAKGNGATGG